MRFPGFEGEWDKLKVRDFTRVVAGATPATDKKEYWGGVIRWMNSGELNLKRVYEVQGRITQLGYDKTSTKIIPPHSVLIGLAGQGKTRGTAAMNYVELCTNQSIASILPSDSFYSEFLYQNVESRYKELRDISSGDGGRGGLNLQMIYNLYIPHCSMQEQKKIGDFLYLLDQRIAIQNKVIEKYESLIKALTDKIVDDLLKGRMVPFNQMYIQAGEGGTPSTSVGQYYLNGTIPFVKIDDLSSKYLVKNKDFINDLGLSKSSAWLIPSNSVIYSNGATIGAISINTYPVSTKQGILGVVPAADVNTEYLYYLMCSRYFSEQVQRIIAEGTMKTAYLKDMNKIQCPLPSLREQKRIVAGLSALSSKLESELAALLSYESIKRYLLINLFI